MRGTHVHTLTLTSPCLDGIMYTAIQLLFSYREERHADRQTDRQTGFPLDPYLVRIMIVTLGNHLDILCSLLFHAQIGLFSGKRLPARDPVKP